MAQQNAGGPNLDAAGIAQLAQLILAGAGGGGGGRRKLNSFSSGEGVDWMTWRNHYDQVAAINDWGNARQLREIQASMDGKAAKQVAGMVPDMPDAAGNGGTPPQEFLDRYQEKFLPPAASRMARSSFLYACQESSEGILDWHSRVKSLYRRANPNDQEWETRNALIDQFVLHLADSDVAKYVFDRQPANIDEALHFGQDKTANQVAFSKHRNVPGAKGGGLHSIWTPHLANIHHLGDEDDPELQLMNNAIAGQGRKMGECWHCGSKEHLRDSCEKFKTDLDFWAKHFRLTPEQKAAVTSRGRGRANNRGRGGYRGRGGKNNFRRNKVNFSGKTNQVNATQDLEGEWMEWSEN